MDLYIANSSEIPAARLTERDDDQEEGEGEGSEQNETILIPDIQRDQEVPLQQQYRQPEVSLALARYLPMADTNSFAQVPHV